MKKSKQIFKRSDLLQNSLSPDETIEFLEQFSKVILSQDSASKLISIRIPENVLNSFKTLAKLQNRKYQTVMVQLMREWVQANSGK
jgi:uncharacterized protein (DUF4415 family)